MKQNANLIDLKKSIQNTFQVNQKIQSQLNIAPQVINWKYIWKNYCLSFNDEKLLDNNKSLRDYGIKNKSELNFLKLNFRKQK